MPARCLVVDGMRAAVWAGDWNESEPGHDIQAGAVIDDTGFATQLEQQWRLLIEHGVLTGFDFGNELR